MSAKAIYLSKISNVAGHEKEDEEAGFKSRYVVLCCAADIRSVRQVLLPREEG